MKKGIFLMLVGLVLLSCKEKVQKSDLDVAETVSESEEVSHENEWTVLFDGTSMDNWQAFKGGQPSHWSIKNNALVFDPPLPEERKDENGEGYKTFNIVTKDSFTSFVLSLEWKIAEGGNSGIFWGISEDEKYVEPYQTGLEIQVLDNTKHPDAKNGRNRQAGALYDLVEPAKDVTKPAGEWNTAVITVNHETNTGSSVLNGVEIATFPVGGDELKAMLEKSKFKGWDGFADYKTGKIGLQDHGDVVSYRNIKIKAL
ncbi:3-keto-disaccharide hydrolase [Costertonia aggregata]|uniref:DUF1080 domain-containing protein n=1 Tax=Costertonia aggregata TaxID=343403 RepID=A0A7H9ANX1_9FLAO|nr:DUF1080 domain-containing protein [Costertonia aggregata]QLG45136.1 DUF1080 domain-containing protein [Costertonia aggregata]